MKLTKIKSDVYYFKSPVNVGYVQQGNQGMLIDAGLDKSAMNKILRQLNEKQLPVTHLFITHGHADHYGGAHHLQLKRDVYTIAPEFEEATLRYPKLEPLYLFHGVNPPEDMRNKFLEAEAIRVDEVVKEGPYRWGDKDIYFHQLAGHSINQHGVLVNDILFAGDSYMSLDVLNKHGLPFLMDASLTLESLNKLRTIHAEGALPGHGKYEKDFKATVQKNIDFYNELIKNIQHKLGSHYPDGFFLDEAVSYVSQEWRVQLNNTGTWALNRTAITAYVMELCRLKKYTHSIKDENLYFSPIK